MEFAKHIEWVTRDTFLFHSNEHNICKKITKGLWKKHPLDPSNMQMCRHENLYFIIYWEHSLLNLNNTYQGDTPFTLGIQYEWQQQMMAKYGQTLQS